MCLRRRFDLDMPTRLLKFDSQIHLAMSNPHFAYNLVPAAGPHTVIRRPTECPTTIHSPEHLFAIQYTSKPKRVCVGGFHPSVKPTLPVNILGTGQKSQGFRTGRDLTDCLLALSLDFASLISAWLAVFVASTETGRCYSNACITTPQDAHWDQLSARLPPPAS